jgi:hypothetical protein
MSRDKPDWFNGFVLRIKPIIVCHACATCYSEHAIENNTPRNLPRSIDAFFFQTTLSNQKLIKKQLKPLTGIVGIGIIWGSIFGLFQLPGNVQTSNQPLIKWAVTPENLSDTGFIKNADLEKLQQEFGQIFREAKKIPASFKTGQ